MARRREEQGSSGWLSTLLSLGVLILVGFGVGVVAGILWEEPRLVLAHLTGGTTEITWNADSRGRAAAPEAAAAEPAQLQPRQEPAVELPSVAAAPRGRLAVQVGAFAESAAAEKLARALRDGGYAVYVTPGARSDTPRWRVRVGPFADRDEADRVAARLKAEEDLPTWVLDEDGG